MRCATNVYKLRYYSPCRASSGRVLQCASKLDGKVFNKQEVCIASCATEHRTLFLFFAVFNEVSSSTLIPFLVNQYKRHKAYKPLIVFQFPCFRKIFAKKEHSVRSSHYLKLEHPSLKDSPKVLRTKSQRRQHILPFRVHL